MVASANIKLLYSTNLINQPITFRCRLVLMYFWLLFNYITHAQTIPFAVKYHPLSSMRWSMVYDYDSMYLGLTNDGILARFDPDFNLLNTIKFKIPVYDTAAVSSLDILTAVLPTDSGYYITGTHHKYYDEEKSIEKRAVFVGFLSESFEQKWVHFITNQTSYNDTILNNPIVSSQQIRLLNETILISIKSENLFSYHNQDSIMFYKDKTFFYKLSHLGKITSRKLIPFLVLNISQNLSFDYFDNKVIVTGYSYYLKNKLGAVVHKRPVFTIVDTAFSVSSSYPFQDSVYEYGISGLVNKSNAWFGIYIETNKFEQIGANIPTIIPRFWHFNHDAMHIYQKDIFRNVNEVDTLSIVFHLAPVENNIVAYQQVLPKRNWNLAPSWQRVGHELVLYDSAFNYIKKKELNITLPIVFSGPNVPHWGNGIFIDRFNKIVLFGGGGYEKGSFIYRLNNNMEQDTLYNFKDLDYSTRFVRVPKDTTITLRITDSTLYIHRVYENWNDPVGLQKQTIAPMQITLSPNPATAQVHVESPIKIEQYKLTNTNGATMQSGVLDASHSIDVSQLPPGLYFLQLQLENGQTVTKKLVRSSK